MYIYILYTHDPTKQNRYCDLHVYPMFGCSILIILTHPHSETKRKQGKMSWVCAASWTWWNTSSWMYKKVVILYRSTTERHMLRICDNEHKYMQDHASTIELPNGSSRNFGRIWLSDYLRRNHGNKGDEDPWSPLGQPDVQRNMCSFNMFKHV